MIQKVDTGKHCLHFQYSSVFGDKIFVVLQCGDNKLQTIKECCISFFKWRNSQRWYFLRNAYIYLLEQNEQLYKIFQMFCKYDFFTSFKSISHDYKCTVKLFMLTCLVFEVKEGWKKLSNCLLIFSDRIMTK